MKSKWGTCKSILLNFVLHYSYEPKHINNFPYLDREKEH